MRNTGQSRIDLIGVRTNRASIETLHKTEVNTQGVGRVSASLDLPIALGEPSSLCPGGLHAQREEVIIASRDLVR